MTMLLQTDTVSLNLQDSKKPDKLVNLKGNLSHELETDFLEKLKEGDTAAFSAFFLAYYADLLHFACRLTANKSVAEEIVQEVFVKLWENRQIIVVRLSLKSYLLKSVQNRCIDWQRHQRIRRTVDEEIKESANLMHYDTDNYILKSELEARLNEALMLLPLEIQEAYRMNRFDGMRYQEIANKLNVSVRTVEVRIGRALHMLRDYLKDFLAKGGE